MPTHTASLSSDVLNAALHGLEAQKQTIERHIQQVRSMLGLGTGRPGRPPKTAPTQPTAPTPPAPQRPPLCRCRRAADLQVASQLRDTLAHSDQPIVGSIP